MKPVDLLGELIADFSLVDVSPLHARLALLPGRFFPGDRFTQAICRGLVLEAGNLSAALANLPHEFRGSKRLRAFRSWAATFRKPARRPVAGLLEWKGGAR